MIQALLDRHLQSGAIADSANVVVDPIGGTTALLRTQRLMTGADDVAMAAELGRNLFPAAAKGEDRL